MATLDPADFSAADPQAFYLLDARVDWEALSDATLVVQGARLPAHSQVLSLQSGVLRGLFADLRSSPGGRLAGQKRKSSAQEGPEQLVLEAPFAGCSLLDAALFLRFCYRPRDLVPASLAAVPDSLPGLLRLAHKLDAQQILGDVSQHMAGAANEPAITRAQLLEWAAAADHCQLRELCLCCLSELTRRMADASDVPAAAFAATDVLQGCNSHLLQLLCGMLLAGGSKQLGSSLPAPGPAAEALQRAANLGSIEWVLERFSQQPAEVEKVIYSPWLTAAGRRWRFEVYPSGKREEAAGHLSVYLQPEHVVKAKFRSLVINQDAEAALSAICKGSAARTFGTDHPTWGWHKFVPLAELRSKPGYLAGDRLVLRTRVEVVA